MYLLFLFASSGTLHEPSSGRQILAMVYNNTPTAKEISELSFFISNAICHQEHHKGDYFKHEALKQLKPVAISFALVIKIILYFPRVLNANRFWKCNIF